MSDLFDENERSLGDDIKDEAVNQAERIIKEQIQEAIKKEAAKAGTEAAVGATAGAAAETSATASASAAAGTGAAAGTTAGASAGAGAGAGAGAAGGPIGIIIAAILIGLQKIKTEFDDITDPNNREKSPTLGIIGSIMFFITIVCYFLFPGLFVSNGSAPATTEIDSNTALRFYQATDLEADKQALFDRIFEEYGITADDIVADGSLYATSNEKNFAVCKEIIDHAIYKAFTADNGFVVEFIHTTLIGRLGEAIRAFFEGDGEALTRQSFFNSRYPYCLNTYTITQYLNGSIPEDELNDDLNYAEVLSVVELNEELTGTQFTFSQFYDIVCDPEMRKHFAEIDYSDVVYYVGRNTERTFASEEEAQAWINENRILGRRRIETEEVEEEDEEDSEEELTDEEEIPEEFLDEEVDLDEEIDDPENWRIHCYVNIDVYPYGLVELFDLAHVSYSARSYNLRTMRNYELMDEYEKNMRLLADEYIDFGTGFEDPRDSRSKVYSKAPTGRSAYCYVDPDKLLFYVLMELPDWDTPNPVRHDIIHVPTDESVLLDMDGWYISQLGNYNHRGNTNSTIHNEGCIDCSYTMCAQYLLDQSINVTAVSSVYVNDNAQFCSDNFLNAFGLGRNNYSGTINETSVRNAIGQGMPVVIGLRGYWGYGGNVYHRSASTHFIVICGYDPTGFYVLDPASASNSNSVIPYEAFDYVSIYTWSIVGVGSNGNISNPNPKFK